MLVIVGVFYALLLDTMGFYASVVLMLCYARLCYAMQSYAVLCNAMLCFGLQCYCYAVLGGAVLWSAFRSETRK